MRLLQLSGLFVLLLSFGACDKFDKDYSPVCSVENSALASNDDYQDHTNPSYGAEVYIVEDLKFNQSCQCYTAGLVKYLRNGKTAALVDYGNGECDNWAVKTLCVDGDCEKDGTTCFKFELNCQSSTTSGN